MEQKPYSEMSIEELEDSDYGRDPRFPAGWWIVPAAIMGAIEIGFLIWVFSR